MKWFRRGWLKGMVEDNPALWSIFLIIACVVAMQLAEVIFKQTIGDEMPIINVIYSDKKEDSWPK